MKFTQNTAKSGVSHDSCTAIMPRLQIETGILQFPGPIPIKERCFIYKTQSDKFNQLIKVIILAVLIYQMKSMK